MGADGSGEGSELTGIDEARRRIAKAARTGATELDLGGLGLTEVPEEIVTLTSLTSLDLAGNQIGADGAHVIAALTGLTSLDLAGNQIGDEGARAIAALTSLASLDLFDNGIGAEGARALANLIRLASLDLEANDIGDDGSRAIAILTGLTSLNLGINDIGAEGARALAALTRLASLNLRGNQIRTEGALALTGLKGLALLDLWDNGIGDDGVRAIATLTNLTSLNLRGKLHQLYLGNEFGDIGVPAETFESGDVQAILAAYRAFRQARGLDDIEPQIPANQKPGYQFALQTDGRMDLQPSGLASPDDLAEILAIRGVIIETIDELTLLLAGSNAYSSVAKAVERYKSAISASDLSIDLLYGYGLRLENSRSRLEIEIAKGDYPDMAVAVGEALDSVIALHGPVVYSTARGRELVERARSFEAHDESDSAYNRAAQQIAAAIGEAKQAVTELARETVMQAISEIGQGKHPERSMEIAHTTLSNFMIGAAKGVQKALSPEIMAETMTKAAYMAAAGTAVGATAYYVGMPLLGFFLANKALLYDFSVAAGCELSWLPSFLNWLERQRASLKR